jgi:hypothetical protein
MRDDKAVGKTKYKNKSTTRKEKTIEKRKKRK